MRRVCDACSVRRVRCDGQAPCAGCVATSLECSRLRTRKKPGPKTIRKTTLERLNVARRGNIQAQGDDHPAWRPAVSNDIADYVDGTVGSDVDVPSESLQTHDESFATVLSDSPGVPFWLANSVFGPLPPVFNYPYQIDVETLGLYLDIYHHKLFPVWPIVDTALLMRRLRAPDPGADAYMLASSVCVATILQLQLVVTGNAAGMQDPQSIVDKVEDLRRNQGYRQHPTLDTLSTSFFLHITYCILGQRLTSTLLLREAISVAHVLGLHDPGHYTDLSTREVQDHLRSMWLLFITERAHASQYDLPCIATISPRLPQINDAGQPFTLSPFIFLCRMFANFDSASSTRNHSVNSLILAHTQLQEVPALTSQYNALQRADLCVTRHWMRLMLWKMAMSHIKMIAEPSGNLDSMQFPMQIAKDLVSSMSDFSIDTLEAHGPGMEMKLFAFATSVADVMVCLPSRSVTNSTFRPQECLGHIASVLGNFRGGNNALLPILQARLSDVGLSVPAVPRLIEIGQETSSGGSIQPSSGCNTALGQNAEEDDTPRLSSVFSSEAFVEREGSADYTDPEMLGLW